MERLATLPLRCIGQYELGSRDIKSATRGGPFHDG
jgi:hypothetical protein